MTSKQSAQSGGGVNGATVVLFLFFMVVAIFVYLYVTVRPTSTPLGADSPASIEAAFLEAMNSGKNLLSQGRDGAERAIEVYQQALQLKPGDLDAELNLANAHLLLNQPEEAVAAGERALAVDRQSAAAYYLVGCGHLRQGEFEEALKHLQTAKDLDHTINAVSFQLGRAHQGLGNWEAAEEQFLEVSQFDESHGATYYNLSQVRLRLGDEAGANEALTKHQEIAAAAGATPTDPSIFEACVYTEVRVPFHLEQPESEGVAVTFVDGTAAILGDVANGFQGPVGILDVGHDGTLDLFARNKTEGFQLLIRRDGAFVPEGFPYPPLPEARYTQCLVGDLQHKQSLMGGRQEDVILLSDQGTQVFRVSPTGMLSDSTLFAQIADVKWAEAVLTDFASTGKLDLVGLSAEDRSLQYLRNQGNFSFIDQTSPTNLPTNLKQIQELALGDWDGDDALDFCLVSAGQAPGLWIGKRNGGLVATNTFDGLPVGRGVVLGDLNNDLRMDLAMIGEGGLTLKYQGDAELTQVEADTTNLARLRLVDYDNDGWLDVLGTGGGAMRVWRNRGLEGFVETTEAVGLAGLTVGEVASIRAADLDGDCDTDLLLTLQDQSLKVLQNDGGNQNQQLKLRLEGNRSNPSALGIKVEVTAGGLRMVRTVRELPLEIGLGKRNRVDAIDPHWSDLVTTTDFEIEGCEPLAVPELELPTGSCPYLYVWDGERYRFVTDLLGAAPLGLPVAEGVLIAADTDEYVGLGGVDAFQPRNGAYELQITEELREVLYLDEAKLVVVDAPEGVELHPTNKLVPRPPFPAAGLMAVHRPQALEAAVRHDGVDVREALSAVDRVMASPAALRAPQLRGLAEPYHFDLDFGTMDVSRPLVLVMNGWLRFGGGMANIGASHNPELPFPFPVLSVETADGTWQALDVVVGAPAGKTKSMVVDLEGQLPEGARRLRLAMAFEIHWDRIALMEKYRGEDLVETRLSPDETDLHWRGFSPYQDLRWDQPLSPDYDRVSMQPPWLITPSGWCTRYGDVGPLVAGKDNRLVLLNGGDELTLRFDAGKLGAPAAGQVRHHFLFTSGWDKDADPHVVQGWKVEPLPWHGMDDQQYGFEARPADLNDDWQAQYNTRWVGQFTLDRKAAGKSENGTAGMDAEDAVELAE